MMEVKVAARKAHQEAKRLATEAVQSELASLREVVVIAKEIAVWTLRAIRYITIAMQHTPPEAFSIHEAQVAIREVQDQANNLRELKFEDVRLEAWTLSMEAYCFAALGSFEEAIAKQKEAIKIGPQQLATNYLNLGCYLARKREFTEAAQALLTAYATGGAAMKDKAKGDPDLAEMRKQPVYKELFIG
jgi:tetratricopeptide (TPR) repeat protein